MAVSKIRLQETTDDEDKNEVTHWTLPRQVSMTGEWG
jgi:hypothetical protein